jgi:UDP:flavonoid glycosyltransferase YjiC (YdhE family)
MKVLLSTWGSRGDFHPFLALALGLQKRGHQVTLAANPYWEKETVEAGVGFLATESYVSPDVIFDYPEILSHRQFGVRALDLFINEFFAPQLDLTVDVLSKAAAGHDLLVAHHFVLAAPVVAKKTKIPFATVTLAPGVIRSRYTAPAGADHQPFQGRFGEWVNDLFWSLGARWCQRVVRKTMDAFYRRHGLSPESDYIFGTWSKERVLQLYSPHFAPPVPDYPPHFHQTGFCFKDSTEIGNDPELERFLKSGEKPWLFTLGTVAVFEPGNFYREAVESVRGTAERALLLVGREENIPPNLPSNVMAVKYAAHEKVMPDCKGVIHQCGIGGVGQSLRAGIPSIGCPFAFDQPNNAARLAGLGVGVVLNRNQRTARDFRAAFKRLAEMGAFRRARGIGEKIRNEEGILKACEVLEGMRSLSPLSQK